MNGLFHLIRKYTAIVSSALKHIPGGIINILHFPISNTTTVFSSPGPRCQTAQDSPLPQSPEIIQTSQSKPIHPALPDPFLEKILLLFVQWTFPFCSFISFLCSYLYVQWTLPPRLPHPPHSGL